MAQGVFHESGVASVVDSAGFDRAAVWFEESPLRIDHLVDLPDVGEEPGFVSGHDYQVEQIPPGLAVRHEAVEAPVHHLLAVRPVGVGDEDQLLSGEALVHERWHSLGVEVDEAFRVGDDGRFERTVVVCVDQGVVDGSVELTVGLDTG